MNMNYLGTQGRRRYIIIVMILGIILFGCSLDPEQNTEPKAPAISAEPNEAAVQSDKITFSLEFEPGTKIRYRITTETIMALERHEDTAKSNTSTIPLPKVWESSEMIYTQEILGPVPESTDTVIAQITIEQVRYNLASDGQPDLLFDTQKSTDQNSPFAKLIGQTYTIEVNHLGYVLGIFNLHPARLAVRGRTTAHAAALEMVSPPAIFPRHGFFSVPGTDVGALSVGGRWRGVQQLILKPIVTNIYRLGTHRFDNIYELESLEQREAGTVGEIVFVGSPRSRINSDGRLIEVPFLSCSYAGGGEFNFDAGRVESYFEQLEVRMPLPTTRSRSTENNEGRIVIATHLCRVQQLDLD